MGTYVQEKQSSPGTKPTLYPRALVQPVGLTQAVSDPRKTAWPHAASAQQCDTWRWRGSAEPWQGGTGSCPQSLSLWPPWEPEQRCCRGEKPRGWERRWGASLTSGCGTGGQQVQQQGGHGCELPWDPPRGGQMAWH